MDNPTFQLTEILSWVKSKHSVKAGFEFMSPQMNLIDFGSVGGSWGRSSTTMNIGSANTASK